MEPASGVVGVLKALIALEKGVLTASLHSDMPNENIQFEELNLHLASKNIPLSTGNKGRFAGVSSFGFGGANAHLIEQLYRHRIGIGRQRRLYTTRQHEHTSLMLCSWFFDHCLLRWNI